MKCYKCGKEMTNEKGESWIGIIVEVIPENKKDIPFAKKQFGKHYDAAASKGGINICWECRIDSLLEGE